MVGGKRVFVTGGCGFIGAYLVRHLLRQGHDVTVLDDLSTGELANLPVAHPRLRAVIGTVLDARVVRDAARDHDVTIHLAGLVGMELVTRSAAQTYRVSAAGTEAVLAETRGPIVLVSSSCVYGHADHVCHEDSVIPRAVVVATDGGQPGYATGKWELEAMARMASAAGRDVLVVRPFNVVGPGQTHRHGMVLPSLLRAALCGEPLTIYGDGLQTRAFSYVEDFVTALARLVETPAAWSRCDRLVNLGDPTRTTILELARVVLDVTRSRSRLVHVDYPFAGQLDIPHRAPHVERVERLLGKLAWTNLRQIVRASVESEHRTAAPRSEATA